MKALIIIDMFEGYAEECYNREKVIKNQVQLIDAFQKKNLPVIIVEGDKNSTPNPVMVRLWGHEFEGEPQKVELVPELRKVEGAKYVGKSEYSAFFRTELEQYCKDSNIDEMYFCGYSSGVCVYFSAADAAMRRILPILVTDASTTNVEEWHMKTIKRFQEVVGPAKTTQETIEDIKNVEAED